MFNVRLSHLMARRFVLMHDAIMVLIAWLAAYWMRFDFQFDQIPPSFWSAAIDSLSLVCLLQIAALILVSAHLGAWRRTSTHAILTVIQGVFIGTAAIAAMLFLLTRLDGVPRSVLPMYALLLTGLLCGSRMLYRLVRERQNAMVGDKRVLVVGAGAAGDMLVRSCRSNYPREYEPVAFVDDDIAKRGLEVQGIRVLGDCSEIPTLVKDNQIALVLLAIPSATVDEKHKAIEHCIASGVPSLTLPELSDIIDGAARVRDLRDVPVHELLGRESVIIDWSSITSGIAGKRVLITGAGGSIGSELCRQVLRAQPGEMILFEQNEENLYQIHTSLQEKGLNDVNVVPRLGDVCNREAVAQVFDTFQPQVIFHAAAYKHVPLLEDQICEAARNNMVGTYCVASFAVEHGSESFVLISTDKAVNPESRMGASKRGAEVACAALGKHCKTRFTTVRFGNVLGSAGSVVPLFTRQIDEGGPVTVTDPEMERYFMTVEEASQLIIQASLIGEGGEIFVLDMGEPVNIDYLARQMIRLLGRIPDKEIEIVYTGLRPGEKLKEELFHPDEKLTDTGYDNILLAATRDVDSAAVRAQCDALIAACASYDQGQIEEIITTLVPEFHPQ